MPELPEVQTVVDYLKPKLPGQVIQSVQSPNGYIGALANGALSDYQKFLTDQQVQSIRRRGKFIIIKFESGYLLIHLRMTGRVVLEKQTMKEMKYVSFQLIFADGSNLFFHDIRKFGRIYICKNLNWLEKKLGIEPLSNDFTSKWLYSNLQKRKRMMKPLLLDQQFIAGLGNIYVDEALWKSGIHPKAISNKISKKRAKKLSTSIQEILNRAISYQGTTFINFSFGQNQTGQFRNQLKIFGKANAPCPKCSNPITKNFVSQRGTHYCIKCQKY